MVFKLSSLEPQKQADLSHGQRWSVKGGGHMSGPPIPTSEPFYIVKFFLLIALFISILVFGHATQHEGS